MPRWLRILLAATTLSACASTDTTVETSSRVETTMVVRLK